MKIRSFLTKSEYGLLILTAIFLCLMVFIMRQVQTEEIAGDYVITTQHTPEADITPEEAPLVDINTADSAALQKLPGIGPALAERILSYREEHGPFQSVEELLKVSGIGEATLEGLRREVTVGKDAE